MARKLDVYLHTNKVGQLMIDEHGQMVFDYDHSWIESPNALPLSQSLPLKKERFKENECRAFFGGILPEETKRATIAKRLGISKNNDFAMLEQIGGECAGAVTFVNEGETLLPSEQLKYRTLESNELLHILESLPTHPLLAGEDGIRLSLAGAQDKIAVHVKDDHISIPLGSAPSTHILKPAIERFEGLVFNEAFCMKLAARLGLGVAKVEIRKIQHIDFLLVERYDRHFEQNSQITRLHQEDFCQALGITSEKKYQSEGGPSIQNCIALVRNISAIPALDLRYLLDALIFNLLIGNNDAHGKNFSLLYTNNGVRFAPLYDLICTVYYPELSNKMAMKIGKEAESSRIHKKHLELLASENGFSSTMVIKRVIELTEHLLDTLPKVEIDHPVTKSIKEVISARALLFLHRFKNPV